jgi:hypothetical protein
MSINFIRDKNIKKQTYKDLSEFKFDKQTDVGPKKNNRLFCIMISEEKGAYFIWRRWTDKLDYFRFKKGMYIIDNESIHITKNGARVSFYLEGISTPIKMSNIEKYIAKIEYTDLAGVKHESLVQKIKGLKFDSKVLDIFANRQFAENFTKQSIDHFQLFIMIFGIINLIVSIIACVLIYYFRGG